MTSRPAAANVVLTGAGLIAPMGLSRREVFDAVCAGRCGIGRLSSIECALPEGRDGGEAPALPDDYLPGAGRETRYLHRAIRDALSDSGIAPGHYVPNRCGIMIGTTLHGMRSAGKFLRTSDFSDLRRFLASEVLKGASCDLACEAMAATTCSACSSSLGSVALAVTMLQSGEFDMVIAGGYDPVSEYAYAGFNSLRLVAEGPLRPFARNRQGMKLSEGYGIVVLERADDALRRGAKIIATVAGFGESADAHHLTQPHPQGDGASRAMRDAIASSGLTTTDIDLLVAHATGTPDNDASEYAAMKNVFGDRLPAIPVVAFKSHLGHTLGGAGVVELILAAMSLEAQVVPPCASVTREEVEFPDLNLSVGPCKTTQLRATLSTSLGFGGANTCVVLTRASERVAPAVLSSDSDRDAVITGIGVVLPEAIGLVQLAQLLSRTTSAIGARQVSDEQIANLVNARRVRRLSEYVKLMLAASSLAFEDAAAGDVAQFAASSSAILATMHGSSCYSETYYRQVVQEGPLMANPMLFAEGVPNAGSAHVSLMLGLKGACQTIIGSRTAGLDALALAMRRIQTGRWDRAVVGAAEEFSPLTNAAYVSCGMGRETPGGLPFEESTGALTSAGAVVMILESRRAARERNVRVRGMVASAASRASSEKMGIGAAADVIAAIGCPSSLVTSANSTWVDRVETAAIDRVYRGRQINRTSLYGHVGELFSATPLAAIAAVMAGGSLPRLLGTGGHKLTNANIDGEFGVVCTDYAGITSGVRVQELARA